MFKNLKIGMRLGLGFGLVLVLLAIISATAVLRVGQISTEITDVVNDKFPKTEWANTVVDNVNVIARALRNSLLVKPEEIQAELDRVGVARKAITENIEKLEKSIHRGSRKMHRSILTQRNRIIGFDQHMIVRRSKINVTQFDRHFVFGFQPSFVLAFAASPTSRSTSPSMIMGAM